jgi:hypothetical protein
MSFGFGIIAPVRPQESVFCGPDHEIPPSSDGISLNGRCTRQRACEREQHRTSCERYHRTCVTHGITARVPAERFRRQQRPLRVGSADVGLFFTVYAKIDGVWLAPAWLEGREVIAVFEDRADPKPSYMMWLEWRDGRISFIRDYRYVRYVVADAELALVPDANPAENRGQTRGVHPWTETKKLGTVL